VVQCSVPNPDPPMSILVNNFISYFEVEHNYLPRFQWQMLTRLDSLDLSQIPPVRCVQFRSPFRSMCATNIQRAYRAHLARKQEAAMLAFAMALHPRLGAESGAAALGCAADVLCVVMATI